MKDCEIECKPTKACVKLKHINVINVSSCKKTVSLVEPGCLFPHQCRKFMIISTRAIPAYQKSSCIQNVAHDLVGHAGDGINLVSSSDQISMMSGKLRSKSVWLCLFLSLLRRLI